MTYSELEARIQTHFENNTYYSSGDIAASIADGYQEVAAYTGCILKSTILAVDANKSYYDLISDISDLIGVICIYNNVTKRWMVPTSLQKLKALSNRWDTVIGTPEQFAIISYRYMALFRKPSVAGYGDLVVYYVAAAPSISGSTAFLIKDEHMNALEDYVKTDLWEQQQEWSKATTQFKYYIQNSTLLRSSIQTQRARDRYKGLK